MSVVKKYIDSQLNEGVIGGLIGGIIGLFLGRGWVDRGLYSAIGGLMGDWLEDYLKYSFAKSIDTCRTIESRRYKEKCYAKIYDRAVNKLKDRVTECKDKSENPSLCRSKILGLISKLERERDRLNRK